MEPDNSPIVTETVARNTGEAFEVDEGQVIRITGSTITDVVAFQRGDFTEHFDQARTKVYNQTIFVTPGDRLMTKSNKPMARIVGDTFTEGSHDLQHGMCSAPRFELAAEEGKISDYYFREIPEDEMPDHGCWENLIDALEPWDVDPLDIPSPLNLFQTVDIDPDSGEMLNEPVRPDPDAHVDFLAEMDCVFAVSSCPDLWAGGDQGVEVEVFEAPDE